MGVNAYKIYEFMWLEQKAAGRTDLPAKWTHAEFIEQLVYDLIFPKQTLAHRVALQKANDDDEGDSSVAQSLSSFGLGSTHRDDCRTYCFTDQAGIDEYLNKYPGTKITKSGMDGGQFARCLDRQFHCTVASKGGTRCQYCYYIWKHTYNSLEQETFNYREKNKLQTVRCLICNVNLCSICINEWHGVEMSDINGLLNL